MYFKRYEEAIAPLQKAIALDPFYKSAHQALWKAFWLTGRKAEAIQALSAALEVMPGDIIIMNRLAWLLAVGLTFATSLPPPASVVAIPMKPSPLTAFLMNSSLTCSEQYRSTTNPQEDATRKKTGTAMLMSA